MKISPTNTEIYQRIQEVKTNLPFDHDATPEVKLIYDVLEYIFRPKEISDDYDLWKELWNFLSSVAKNKWNEICD